MGCNRRSTVSFLEKNLQKKERLETLYKLKIEKLFKSYYYIYNVIYSNYEKNSN